jgi:hypothetical protein
LSNVECWYTNAQNMAVFTAETSPCRTVAVRSWRLYLHVLAMFLAVEFIHVYCIETLIWFLSCNFTEVFIQYLKQQIVQSVINNNLSLMFLLHVSTSTRSSSERYIQRHTSTANSVKDVCVKS